VLIKAVVGGMTGAINYPTRGGHPRWRTWSHDLPFPQRRSWVRAEEEERGERERERRGDVATDEWGPRVSNTRA
jgi:hypothetical protein